MSRDVTGCQTEMFRFSVCHRMPQLLTENLSNLDSKITTKMILNKHKFIRAFVYFALIFSTTNAVLADITKDTAVLYDQVKQVSSI